jgi:tRNA(Glu) U13 pseudouridine synthase TruD
MKYGRRSMVLRLCGNRLGHDNKDKPSKKTSLKFSVVSSVYAVITAVISQLITHGSTDPL